jgi:hypothetical protein
MRRVKPNEKSRRAINVLKVMFIVFAGLSVNNSPELTLCFYDRPFNLTIDAMGSRYFYTALPKDKNTAIRRAVRSPFAVRFSAEEITVCPNEMSSSW